MTGNVAIGARSAIEALRAGVPNRAAIQLLGTNETALSHDFLDRLRLCSVTLSDNRQTEGIAIAGGFGAGKSHQLGYFSVLALQENFIVSPVPISKETPLFDSTRLFAAAIRGAVVPGANDDVTTAVMSRLRPNSDRYQALEVWTTAEVQLGTLSPLFAALLHLIPRRTTDPDDHARMARFFGGGKLNVSVVRGWLRDAGAGKLFDLKPVREIDLSAQRMQFAPRLFRAAGYSGWCILLDEVELIGRYSPLQRGRSYAELVRWLGLDKEKQIPGVITVAAITDDFAEEMFHQRRDDELIPPRLRDRGLLQQADMAATGIAWLEQRQSQLRSPDEAGLRQSLHKISRLYRDAYEWSPPETDVGERLAGQSMRQYVKSWITTWDMERLYGAAPPIEVDTIPIDYTESSDIEQAPTTSGDDDADA